MHTHTEVFLNTTTTPRAELACSAWVNRDHTTTSFFRFVGRELEQLRPPSIKHALGEVGLCQSEDVQVLDGDKRELGHKATAEFLSTLS